MWPICTGCGSHFENPTNFKSLKDPLLVQKQIIYLQKALDIRYLQPEGQCQALKKVCRILTHFPRFPPPRTYAKLILLKKRNFYY